MLDYIVDREVRSLGLEAVEETYTSTEKEEQDGTKGKQKSTDNLVQNGHGFSPEFFHG
tara:strand:+ start:642 stop:815 length:174 start_codon:yes stop_codon:yes gene_type:complete